MSKNKSTIEHVKQGDALSDKEYNELMRQKQSEERQNLNSNERIRQTSADQMVKIMFWCGVAVGALGLFILLTIAGQLR